MEVKPFRFLFNLLIRLLLSWEGKGQAVFSVLPLQHLNAKSNDILTEKKKIGLWYFYHMNNFLLKRSRKKKHNSCNLNLLIISG